MPMFTLLVLALADIFTQMLHGPARASAQPLAATPTTMQLQPASAPLSCQFNRIAISPDRRGIVVWQDRKPGFLRPASHAPASELAVLSDGTWSFFRIRGEASAVNWRSSAGAVEMIVDGRDYGLLDIGTAGFRLWQIHPVWSGVDIKNARWDGARELIDNHGIANAITEGRGRYARFAGSVISADNAVYRPAAIAVPLPQRTGRAASLFDLPYAQQLYSLPPNLTPPQNTDYLWRPVFDNATGAVAGWQTPAEARLTTGEGMATQPAPYGLVKDAVALGNRTVMLSATPNGDHYVSLGDPDTPVSRLCGTAGSGSSSSSTLVDIASRGHPSLAFWHQQSPPARSRTLAVRFHGGPFGSIVDGYPFTTTRKLIAAGYDVLEVDGVGARQPLGTTTAPRVTPEATGTFSRRLGAWIGQHSYNSVVIVGESFGAIGAASLATHGAVPVRQVVLLAPLTVLSPDRSMSGQPLHEGSLQWHAERIAFGEGPQRATLSRWVGALIRDVCTSGKAVVITGSRDRRVPSATQAPCIQDLQQVVPFRDHTSLFDDPRTWEWLGRQEQGARAMLPDPGHSR